jgi:hypothetical protein
MGPAMAGLLELGARISKNVRERGSPRLWEFL